KSVTVTMRGIPTTIERSHIATITYPQTTSFPDAFAQRMAKLDARDVNGRLALAREAFDQREYVLARDAVESALRIDPNNSDAVALRETIQSQMRLERNKPAPGEPVAPTAREGTPAATQPAMAPGAE